MMTIIEEFDKKKHIEKMNAPVAKLLGVLKKDNIHFEPTDGVNENVIFSRGDKTIKMAHHSFYRFSGMTSWKRPSANKDDHTIVIIPVTDEMWLFTIIKPIIETLLEKA